MNSQKPLANENPPVQINDKNLGDQNRISNLKLWIILLLLVIAIILIFILNNWLKGPIPEQWQWLDFIPWLSLNEALIAIVVVVFAYEWIVRKETEKKLDLTLRTHFEDQAKSIEKQISKALIIEPDVMRQFDYVVVDNIIRKGLEIRLRDDQLAKETYDSLLSQLLISDERRSNYRCKVSLRTFRGSSDDIRQKYYEGYINVEYYTYLQKNAFRFTCVASTEEYNKLLRDPSWELRWIIEPTQEFPVTDKSVFDVVYISVGGKPLRINPTNEDGKYVIVADLPELQSMFGKLVKVDYCYKTQIQKLGHLLMVNVPCPTKSVRVEFEYGDTDIHYVNIQDLIVSKAASSIHRTPGSIEIDVDDWVFPKGGVVFVWVLRSEKTQDFLELMRQGAS